MIAGAVLTWVGAVASPFSLRWPCSRARMVAAMVCGERLGGPVVPLLSRSST